MLRLSRGRDSPLAPVCPINKVTDMDEPTPVIDPPESRHCAVCGEAASYGFGPPGRFGPAEAWYCGAHREEGEQRWATRYGALPPGG